MATIKPFKGLRPPKELVEQVASRPYDVLNSDEARAEAAGNEKSLYHIIRPEIDFPVGTDEHAPEVYQNKTRKNVIMSMRKRCMARHSSGWWCVHTSRIIWMGLLRSMN